MKPDFDKLWKWHPSNLGIAHPCTTDGEPNFEDQCAIRMGECINNAGISTDSFKGAKCYPGHGHSQSHILRAEELAKWMVDNANIFGKVEIEKNMSSSSYEDRQGIIFLLNFWGQGNQGDHIDLWNGKKMTQGRPDYFTAAQEVWFWELAS